MSATNLDLPVLIAPEQIRRREFVTTRRGYDPSQVRDYMEQLADQVDLMQSLLREARAEAEAATRASEKPRIDPYDELARRVSGVIREADNAAEQIRSGARDDAERLTEAARTDADRIRTDAQARAEEMRSSAESAVVDARAEADRTISGLAARRDALVQQLGTMQERLLAVAHDLERTIEIDAPDMAQATDDTAAAEDVPAASAGMPEDKAKRSDVVVDVTSGDRSETGSGNGGSADVLAEADALFAELDDPAYEELWSGTQAMRIEMPDIPPLDLDWGDDDDDLDDLRD